MQGALERQSPMHKTRARSNVRARKNPPLRMRGPSCFCTWGAWASSAQGRYTCSVRRVTSTHLASVRGAVPLPATASFGRGQLQGCLECQVLIHCERAREHVVLQVQRMKARISSCTLPYTGKSCV